MRWPFKKQHAKKQRHIFLTKRQQRVLELMAQGLQNKEIGYALGIDSQTVKNHVSVILFKLGVFNRTQAVVEGIKKGLIKNL